MNIAIEARLTMSTLPDIKVSHVTSRQLSIRSREGSATTSGMDGWFQWNTGEVQVHIGVGPKQTFHSLCTENAVDMKVMSWY